MGGTTVEVSQKEIFALFYEQNDYTQVFVSHAVEAAYGEVRGKRYMPCAKMEKHLVHLTVNR